jgi:hypothetical protein
MENGKLSENVQVINKWIPTTDASMLAMKKTVEEVGVRVATLEAGRQQAETYPPRPNGHHSADENLGIVIHASKAAAHALSKGTRAFRHSPIAFDLGSKSSFAGEDDDSTGTESRFTHPNSRPPKSDFPKFDGENPRWWKKDCEKIL